MRYIYHIRTDALPGGKAFGIDIWKIPDRDARLHRSYPALFTDRETAERLIDRLNREHSSPDCLPSLLESAGIGQKSPTPH